MGMMYVKLSSLVDGQVALGKYQREAEGLIVMDMDERYLIFLLGVCSHEEGGFGLLMQGRLVSLI